MASRNVNCDVISEDNFGSYANAFRVIYEGSEVVLDFCVYSETNNTAKLVSRIRVSQDFLDVMVGRILQSKERVQEGKVYVFPKNFDVEH